jgi:hypothetical protein
LWAVLSLLLLASFDVRYDGAPFPLPSLSGALHYGRDKSLATTVPLRITRTAQCPAVRKIKLDGIIDPKEWASTHAENLLMSPEGGRSAVDPTEFFFAHDDGGIYLAARCSFGSDRPCIAKVVKRDGPISREDCAGWLLSPADSVVVQIYANPLGTVLDGWGRMVGSDAMMDYKWTGDLRAAATRGTDRWSVEVYVPYKTLGYKMGIRPSEMRLNFRRKQPAARSAADWMPFAFSPAAMGRLDLLP